MSPKSLAAVAKSLLIAQKNCWEQLDEQQKIGRIIGRFKSAHSKKINKKTWQRLFYEGILLALVYANEQGIDIEERLDERIKNIR